WPSAAHPRLVVVPFADDDGLAELEARVRELVGSLGLPVDDHRPFRPHITLARFARSPRSPHSPSASAPAREVSAGRVPPRVALPFDAATLEAVPRFDTLTLYSSTLARPGARYRALASVGVPLA
ncbi:2'-5' RNA ligase family protein, partial [Trinickia sp.]|uniref:2'-5' RNA ligase family protein n=1 Tax=Trinickia sp. TaxID=2571163 RepID=UPI003F7DE419